MLKLVSVACIALLPLTVQPQAIGVQPGADVRLIMTNGNAVKGKMESAWPDSLSITSHGSSVRIRWDSISHAEVRKGRTSGMRYALAGFIAGGVGVGAGLKASTRCSGSLECQNIRFGEVIALGAWSGALVGAAIGYLVRPAAWHDFSANDARIERR